MDVALKIQKKNNVTKLIGIREPGEKPEPSHVAGGHVKGCRPFGKLFGGSSKVVKRCGPRRSGPAVPFLGIYVSVQNTHPFKNVFINIHCRIIHHSQKVERYSSSVYLLRNG